jgi:predicted flap endonuclease-1-like 5' DNA nuclease
MGYKIIDVEGIGAATAERLAKAGISRTNHLLAKCATPKGRKAIAETTGLQEQQILKFTNLADLMRVKGVGEEFSELLEAAGVDTVKELKGRVPANLHAKLAEANATRKMVRRAPTLKEVEKWVAFAKTLDAVVTY